MKMKPRNSDEDDKDRAWENSHQEDKPVPPPENKRHEVSPDVIKEIKGSSKGGIYAFVTFSNWPYSVSLN